MFKTITVKKIIILIFLTLGNISCEKDDNGLNNTCNVSNPIEELDWLKQKVEELEETDSDILQYFYITQTEFKTKTIFIFPNCCPFCNTIIQVFNCEGETIGYIGDGNFDSTILENDKIIWKPENFSCDI